MRCKACNRMMSSNEMFAQDSEGREVIQDNCNSCKRASGVLPKSDRDIHEYEHILLTHPYIFKKPQ